MNQHHNQMNHLRAGPVDAVTRTVVFHALGGPEVLQIEAQPRVEPKPGEVRLRVEAVGLNHSEGAYVRGTYVEQPRLPSKLGYEAVGIVTAVGDGVDPSLIGRRVSSIPGFSMNDYGVLSEQAILPVRALTEAPSNLAPSQAAAVWTSHLTAYGALVLFGNVRPRDYVIIRASSSSVGVAAIQTAKAEGATVIAATRTSAKRADLLALGADYVIASDEEDLPARVKEITAGNGARLILDPVGGPDLEKLAEAAARDATIFLFGSLSEQPNMFPRAGWGKGLSIRAYTMMELWATSERMEKAKQYIYQRLEDGQFSPKIAKMFGFEDVRKAFEYQARAEHVGKIVITF
jgi:NADPH:quinone reductase-like Zn-dependent oxidoreductase